jgi:hypothetical protein
VAENYPNQFGIWNFNVGISPENIGIWNFFIEFLKKVVTF